ncbi:DUF2955 domain-containing protein [Vibrio sp. ZSDZ34]|uniref:DUF2955 domain-containing protein n=1 Tax=Vibrio gelatinilyticus TaxID=2893468 RepID=A0A9X2AX14_9VIBR|nr:DUF2955 domain-containing protein [Vibrio gelatinilyticus]MCJ2377861.1 DUF2955 domain-containing protein [Vibrio gelatinilyticus]
MKTLRIWFACSLGLALSVVFGLDYGFLGIILPMFVLSNTDSFNVPLLLLILVSSVWTTIQAMLLVDIMGSYPMMLLLAVALVFMTKCIAMTNKKTFLIGYMGIVIGSLVLNLATYPFVDIEDMSITVWVYAALNIVICAIAYWVFPAQEESHNASGGEVSSPAYVAENVLTVWIVAMVAFVTFQVLDLYDSAAAHASMLVILAPMSCAGALKMAKVRIIGTAMGCAVGLGMQMVLGLWFESAFLYWLLFTIAMGPFCYWQTQGPAKGAIAFSAMAALTVPMTSALSPGDKDAFFALLYRFSSIFVAVVVSAVLRA